MSRAHRFFVSEDGPEPEYVHHFVGLIEPRTREAAVRLATDLAHYSGRAHLVTTGDGEIVHRAAEDNLGERG